MAQSMETPVAIRIDHVMVEHKMPAQIYGLFTKQFQLPVMWPMADYGQFSSGGVFFGNVVLEFGRFGTLPATAPQNARLAGIALAPAFSAAASITALDQRNIGHGAPEPFTTTNANGQSQTLWTNVVVNDIGPSRALLFVCHYQFDTQPALTSSGSKLASIQGGPLGLLGVKDIVVETTDFDASRAKWRALLAPAQEKSPDEFTLGSGPAIKLVKGSADALRSLTLEVASLPAARQALTDQNVATIENGAGIEIAGKDFDGLRLTLVQR